MHGAGGRLDHDRRLVAPAVGHLVQLQFVGDQGQRPAAAGVGAVIRSAGRAAGGRRPGARSGWCGPPRRAGRAGRCPGRRQCRTGSITTRRPSAASPTTSWPGTNGKLTIGSNHRDDRPSTVARSLPQIPDRRGRTTCHSGPGQRRRIDVGQPQRAGPPAAARSPARRHPGRGEPGDRPVDLQRLHAARPDRQQGPGPARAPSASARRASPVCGRWRPAWSRD